MQLGRHHAVRREHVERAPEQRAQARVRQERPHRAEPHAGRPVALAAPYLRERLSRGLALHERGEDLAERARRGGHRGCSLGLKRIRLVEAREVLAEREERVVQPHLVALGLGRDVVDLGVGEDRVERLHEVAATPRHGLDLGDAERARLLLLGPAHGRQEARIDRVRVGPLVRVVADRVIRAAREIVRQRARADTIAEHAVKVVAERGLGWCNPRGIDALVARRRRGDAGGEAKDTKNTT